MLASCILVTSLLCMSHDYLPVTHRLSLFKISSDVVPKEPDPEALKRLGVEVAIVAEDAIIPTPLKELDSICDGGQCTYYRKYCYAQTKQCVYSYAPLEDTPQRRPMLVLENFSIRYQTDDALHAAEDHIYLVTGNSAKPNYVPLSQLKLSTLEKLPSCPWQSDEPGCPGPPIPP